jgi:hypothetical protein
MDIPKILSKRYPDAQWTLNGDSYSGLTWLSAGKKPTKKELEAHWPTVQQEIADEAQAKLDAKASAIAKLEALGLTVDEVQVAFGLVAE